MLLLDPALRAAIERVRRADRGAALVAEAAAAVHLGRAPREPAAIAARGRRGTPAKGGAVVAIVAPLERAAPTVDVGGVRVTSLERTIVDLLARPTQPGAPWLVAELLRGESAVEHRRVDPVRLAERAMKHRRGVVRRRVAWMLERAGHEALAIPLRRGARGGTLALDPLGGAGGPCVAPYRLRINTADGLDDPRGAVAPALGEEARARLGVVAVDLALLVVARVSLEAAAAALGSGAALVRAVDEAVQGGLLTREAGRTAARAPFDRACADLLAATRPATRARRAKALATAIARGGGVAERVDALLIAQAAGDSADVARGLRLLGPEVASLDPGRASRLLGICPVDRVHRPARLALLERLGRWRELAREAEAALEAGERDADRLRVRLARACWALGQHRACDAHLRAIERLGAAADSGVLADTGLLRATLATERGDHARAARRLREVLHGAERAGDDRARARALHRLGTLEARRGRLAEASAFYRAALEVMPADAPEAPPLTAVLRSNLAATALWLGRWDEATALGARALDEKLRSGTLAEITVTRVLLARIARARGLAPTRGAGAELVEAAERSGDARLRVEAWLDLAEELARGGAPVAAGSALERARTALALLAGVEPVLAAMADHVEGLLRALAGDADGGVAQLDRAAEAFDALEGAFWAARARRDAASACEAAGDRRGALARYANVVRACARARFVLGEDARHAPLYARAALEGDPASREAAAAALAGIGSAEVRRLLHAAGRRGTADALGARALSRPGPEAVAVVRGADGTRFVDARERDRVLLGAPRTVVLDERAPALVRSDGVRLALTRRRVIGPLLAYLAARAGEPVSVTVLARDVWGRREGASARAAVKMSISRLRAMLGPDREAVVVARSGQTLAYAWSDAYELRTLASLAHAGTE